MFDVELLGINPSKESYNSTKTSVALTRKGMHGKRPRSIWDLPPTGDLREHMCFNQVTMYGALALLSLSFSFMLYAIFKDVNPLSE